MDTVVDMTERDRTEQITAPVRPVRVVAQAAAHQDAHARLIRRVDPRMPAITRRRRPVRRTNRSLRIDLRMNPP